MKADATSADFSVDQNVASKLWFVTNKVDKATYDVRVLTDEYGLLTLNVFANFSLDIRLVSKSTEWMINDTTNAMNFDVKAPGGDKPLAVQQLVSWMPLRAESLTGLTYLDIATETKGYIYVLLYTGLGSDASNYCVELYSPVGTFLSRTTGVAAGAFAVDKFRTMYTLNYEVLAGSSRIEPTLAQWIPTNPG